MTGYHLRLYLRRAWGRRRRQAFLRATARALDLAPESLALLDLPQTDQLLAALNAARAMHADGSAPLFQQSWTAHELAAAVAMIDRLQERVALQPMFLLRGGSVYCGAVATTSDQILRRAFHLALLDREDLRAVNEDASCGIIFEHYTSWTNHGVYDLQVWGAPWLAALDRSEARAQPA